MPISEETRLKKSEAMKRRWADPEHQRKVSEAKNRVGVSDDARRRMSEAALKRWAGDARQRHSLAVRAHYTKKPDERLRASQQAIERWAAPEAREKHSATLSAAWADDELRRGSAAISRNAWSHYVCRNGRAFHMRSPLEVLFAKWLDERGYDWSYEPRLIALPNGARYKPDFVLADGRMLETKGRDKRGLHKVHLARATGHRVILVDLPFMRRLGLPVDYVLWRNRMAVLGETEEARRAAG